MLRGVQGGEALARKLSEARVRVRLTQEEVAQALGISRELVSRWESGERVPATIYLRDLAAIYRVKEESLVSAGPLVPQEGLRVLLREEVEGELTPQVRLELQKWLDFLDAYADFLEEEGALAAAYLKRPPQELKVVGGPLTDQRQASRQAMAVREYFSLGKDAIPEPYVFLDELGLLVYRASLGAEPKKAIWGAFYNHPRLGFSVLVNVDSTPGRQAFTLAHELAHALYHHQAVGIVCRREGLSPEEEAIERFANAWAAHFLVPGKALREQARALIEKRRTLGPEEAFLLAHHFRVSYALLLLRLANEALITKNDLAEWQTYNVRGLAERLGLDYETYEVPTSPQKFLGLRRYPPSVLARVRRAVLEDRLSMNEAAGLLDVDSATLRMVLLSKSKGEEPNPEIGELNEELAFSSPGRRIGGFAK